MEKIRPKLKSNKKEAPDDATKCPGPPVENCKMCMGFEACKKNRLYFNAPIPRYIIEYYLPKLSGAELKVYLYLNEHAYFGNDDKRFGKATLTTERIAEGTGLGKSKIHIYTNRLVVLGLIKKKISRHTAGEGKDWVISGNIYTVTWRTELKRLGIRGVQARK